MIRIEPPGGDPLRLMEPVAEGCSARFRALNRGKRVIELALKQPSGRQRLVEMVTAADVFVRNWAAGTATRLGLDARRLTTTLCAPRW